MPVVELANTEALSEVYTVDIKRDECNTKRSAFRSNVISSAGRSCLARIHCCREWWLVAHVVFLFTTCTVIVRSLTISERHCVEDVIDGTLSPRVFKCFFLGVTWYYTWNNVTTAKRRFGCHNFSWCDMPLSSNLRNSIWPCRMLVVKSEANGVRLCECSWQSGWYARHALF